MAIKNKLRILNYKIQKENLLHLERRSSFQILTLGVHFQKVNKPLISDKIGKYEAQASPDVFFHNNKYHMFFCYRGGKDYRGKKNGYRIGYAFSTDLLNWERNDNYVGIDISEDGFDDEMVSYPHVFEINGKIHMFYLGNGVGKEGFGWATLENDLL